MSLETIKLLIAEIDSGTVVQVKHLLTHQNFEYHMEWCNTLDELIRELRMMSFDLILVSQTILKEAKETHWCNLSYSASESIWIALIDNPDAWRPPQKCPVQFHECIIKPLDLNETFPFRLSQVIKRTRLSNAWISRLSAFKSIIENLENPICIFDLQHRPLYKNKNWLATIDDSGSSILSQINPGQDTQIITIHDINHLPVKMVLNQSRLEWNGNEALFVMLSPCLDTFSDPLYKTSVYSNVKTHLVQPVEQLMAFFNNLSQDKSNLESSAEEAQTITSELYSKISALAEISQFQNGDMNIKKEQFDLLPILNEVIQKYESVSEQKNVALQVLLPESIKPLLGDRDRIQCILSYLLDNAFEYNKSGSIDVSVLSGREHVACSIFYTGQDMKADTLKTIFAPLHAVKDVSHSSMSLPLVKLIIEAHGGKIWAEGEQGQGTHFTFTLPYFNKKSVLLNELTQALKKYQSTTEHFTLFTLHLHNFEDKSFNSAIESVLKSSFESVTFTVQDEASHHYLISQTPINQSQLQVFRKAFKQCLLDLDRGDCLDFHYKLIRFPDDTDNIEFMVETADENLISETQTIHAKEILIVDDEDAVLDTLNRMLRQAGYRHIHTAGNGEKALVRIEKQIPNLIILDMRMPEMSGYELLGRLKENPKYRAIPILIMSGFPLSDGLRNEAESSLDMATLSKPISRQELLQAVYNLL